MFEDIQIFATGWKWNSEDILNEYYRVNPFNKNDDYEVITDRLDLTPYLTSLSTLRLTHETTEQYGNTIDYFVYAGNIDITVSDIIPFQCTIDGVDGEYYMHDFFKIFEDTSYTKYFVEIYYKNNLLIQGMVNQEAIESEISISQDSEQIKLQVVSLDKTFKEYFESRNLSDQFNENNISTNWKNLPYPIKFLHEFPEIQYPKYMFLDELLEGLFKIDEDTFSTEVNIDDVQPNINGSTKRWYLVERPHIQKVHPDIKLAWFHSGLQKIMANDENCYLFLRKLCDSMGWTFGIYIKNNKTSLVLRNRFNGKPISYIINNSNLIGDTSFKIRKMQKAIGANFIIVKAGEFDAGYYFYPESVHESVYGRRCYVMSDVITGNLKADAIEDFYIINGELYPIIVDGYFSRILSEGDSNNLVEFQYYRYENPPSKKYQYHKSNVLFIDGGLTGKMRIDLSNKTHWDDSTSNVGIKDILWSGNYGGMLGYHATDYNFPYHTYTYKDYTWGNAPEYPSVDKVFRRNYETFLRRHINIEIEVTVNEILTDPNISLMIDQEVGYYANQIFSITEMEIDFINNTTTLTLVRND